MSMYGTVYLMMVTVTGTRSDDFTVLNILLCFDILVSDHSKLHVSFTSNHHEADISYCGNEHVISMYGTVYLMVVTVTGTCSDDFTVLNILLCFD